MASVAERVGGCACWEAFALKEDGGSGSFPKATPRLL